MTDRTTAQTLQDAAFLLRNPLRGLKSGIDPDLAMPLADWLDETAERHEAAVVAARHVWGSEDHEKAREWLTTGHGRVGQHALAVARQILGEESQP